mmetsp:Transcript_23281/g.31090  ORF Transcript_23281/g.31090 Transcript_23281/m.31090 type:complete len:183 (+) Transcript_23281:595-1143(+)|eukprot:CAMPEP_0185590014 /NCGR_PEP_ID=MMETSP0434-20130131/59119_1 /TAXON_ID=626734 ORGANISM="Favella taraikaensis, Strain Fe Narragansett Bay" /NCGR_SAMPLE_ID=MMETSP0434 /ASSEMBLY_ACC=CAM_ASM_000379 /LENGTH=182 /DNA_ID=CAMNT_0028213851 /DNA_START=359 /DNA_END=907 /DNA_ORIENTATION=-
MDSSKSFNGTILNPVPVLRQAATSLNATDSTAGVAAGSTTSGIVYNNRNKLLVPTRKIQGSTLYLGNGKISGLSQIEQSLDEGRDEERKTESTPLERSRAASTDNDPDTISIVLQKRKLQNAKNAESVGLKIKEKIARRKQIRQMLAEQEKIKREEAKRAKGMPAPLSNRMVLKPMEFDEEM